RRHDRKTIHAVPVRMGGSAQLIPWRIVTGPSRTNYTGNWMGGLARSVTRKGHQGNFAAGTRDSQSNQLTDRRAAIQQMLRPAVGVEESRRGQVDPQRVVQRGETQHLRAA